MKHLVTFRPQIRLGLTLLAVATVAIVFAISAQRAYGQDIAKLDRFMQAKGNTASMQIFREGRDYIETQNWQRAADKFNDFIKGFPKDKDLDAALYWYGYALQKQDRKEESRAALVRLINKFPNSSWRNDAQALLVLVGGKVDVEQALERENCEIKILALQSLFQADRARAMTLVTDALRANPTPCPGFQAAAVSMLGSHGGASAVPMLLEIARSNPDQKLRLTAIKRLGDQHNDQVATELIKIYDADRTKEIRSQVLRALLDSRTAAGNAKVLEIARTGDDIASRQMAIRYMGDMKDSASLDELIRIYDADKTQESRGSVLRALADRVDARAHAKIFEIARQGDTPDIRVEAIRRLGEHGKIALDELLQLYTSETNLLIKQGLLRAFAENTDPRGQAKLFEVARGNEAVELRSYAIRRLGDRDEEQTITQLVSMYDSEQNPQLRAALLRAFGDSKHKVAVRKLMTIARNDPSVEIRKTAVRYLGESKDPEALKFLEDLLK